LHDAGHTSEIHQSSDARREDAAAAAGGEDAGSDGNDEGRMFTLDFNLGTINRRRNVDTRLVAATLYLSKKLTRADNGTL